MNSALQLLAQGFIVFLGLGDDLLRHVFRAGVLVAKLHGELAAAGGHGAEVADVAEHDTQRGRVSSLDPSNDLILRHLGDGIEWNGPALHDTDVPGCGISQKNARLNCFPVSSETATMG